MAEGRAILLMSCKGCGDRITLDEPQAEWWPSVVTDGATGGLVDADAPVPADPVRKPLCVSCIERIEAERKRLGLPVAWPVYGAKRRR